MPDGLQLSLLLRHYDPDSVPQNGWAPGVVGTDEDGHRHPDYEEMDVKPSDFMEELYAGRPREGLRNCCYSLESFVLSLTREGNRYR